MPATAYAVRGLSDRRDHVPPIRKPTPGIAAMRRLEQTDDASLEVDRRRLLQRR